jgi:transposase-like protein
MITVSDYFCPNAKCECCGLRGHGNLVKAGTYKSHGINRQMFQCKICKTRFSETRNTIFYGSRYSADTIDSIIRSVSEGNGVRATARKLGLSKDSVNKVILFVGKYSETVMNNLLKNLHLKECQMDELWSFINKKNIGRRRISKGIRYKMDMDSFQSR